MKEYQGFDALKALGQGKRLRIWTWAPNEYIVRKGDNIVWNDGREYSFAWRQPYKLWEEPKLEGLRIGKTYFGNNLTMEDIGNPVKLRNGSLGIITAAYDATPGLHPVPKFWVNQNMYNQRGMPMATGGNDDIIITDVKRDGKWQELSPIL